MNNRFIKKLTVRQTEDLVNYVFPNIEPGMVTASNKELSQIDVYYDMADVTLTVAVDDFEGFSEAAKPVRPCLHKESYMDAEQQIRFFAWMYHHFREVYLKALTRYLIDKYAAGR